MSKYLCFGLLGSFVLDAQAQTVSINNPGFENHFNGWTDIDPSAISGDAHRGSKSAKITGSAGRVSQTVELGTNTSYRLSAYVLGAAVVGVSVDGKTFEARADEENWKRLDVSFSSGSASQGIIYGKYGGGEGRFDNFSITQLNTPPNPAACDTVRRINIVAATDDGSNDGNLPSKTIDRDFRESSRWSSKGSGKWINFDLGRDYRIKQIGLAWYKGNQRRQSFSIDTLRSGSAWSNVLSNAQSSGATQAIEKYDMGAAEARYIRLIGLGNTANDWNSVIEAEIYVCDDSTPTPNPTATVNPTPTPKPGLDPSLPPSGNFDLRQWNISIPIDEDGNGRSDNISESDLNQGYENANFFYTADDGGMVFKCPIAGYKTSTNTSYTRVELREMLRAGDTRIATQGVNKNNWVFGSAPSSDRDKAGGVDGNMQARLAVNKVTTSGSSSQVGRVIVGQIHANDNEPIRLYYRKLPNNSKGSIYFAHETRGGSERYVEMIGSRSSSASNPRDGIALDEPFGYEINVNNNLLTVKIRRAGKADIVKTLDMSDSAYDRGGQYMYFKAGVYNQNNTGDDNDYVQATFYSLTHTHGR